MICQDCGVEAPTKYVAFYQNIGALVMRFSRSVEGNLCKSCIQKHFWSMTMMSLFLGWWGMISLIINPFILLNNIIRYLMCLGMDPVPIGAVPPQLSDEVVDRISRYSDTMFERLANEEDFQTVIESTAQNAGVTPGQVVVFIQAVMEAQKRQQASQ